MGVFEELAAVSVNGHTEKKKSGSYKDGKPKKKIKYSFWRQESAEYMDMDNADIASIPEEYMVPQPAKVNREKLFEHLKKMRDEGKDLPFGIEIKRTDSIRWR